MPADSTPPNLPKPPPTTHQRLRPAEGSPQGAASPLPHHPRSSPVPPRSRGSPSPSPHPRGPLTSTGVVAAGLSPFRRGAELALSPPQLLRGLRGSSAPVMAAEAAYRSQLRSVFPSVPPLLSPPAGSGSFPRGRGAGSPQPRQAAGGASAAREERGRGGAAGPRAALEPSRRGRGSPPLLLLGGTGGVLQGLVLPPELGGRPEAMRELSPSWGGCPAARRAPRGGVRRRWELFGSARCLSKAGQAPDVADLGFKRVICFPPQLGSNIEKA